MKSEILRIIAAVMAVIMIITCFAACGKNEEEEESTKPNVEAPVTSPGEEIDLDNIGNDDTDLPEIELPDDDGDSDSSGIIVPSDSEVNLPSNSGSGTGTGTGTGSGTTANISQADMVEALSKVGYEYDAEQQIYYSTLNPWQRHFGFGDEYDQLAVYANMRYTTLKIDFEYEGLLWRLQWWKGQYGVLEGAELGVYTKDPDDNSTTFYECAEDENLLTMSFKYYHSVSDYNKGNVLFYREEQEHWWLTGFKFGYVDSRKNVVEGTVIAKDKKMADGIESGLRKVTDADGNWDGFISVTEYGQLTAEQKKNAKNIYKRDGNKFTVIWLDAGYENYNDKGQTIPEEDMSLN